MVKTNNTICLIPLLFHHILCINCLKWWDVILEDWYLVHPSQSDFYSSCIFTSNMHSSHIKSSSKSTFGIAVGASSHCYWEELLLLKCELMLIECELMLLKCELMQLKFELMQVKFELMLVKWQINTKWL